MATATIYIYLQRVEFQTIIYLIEHTSDDKIYCIINVCSYYPLEICHMTVLIQPIRLPLSSEYPKEISSIFYCAFEIYKEEKKKKKKSFAFSINLIKQISES